MASMVPTASFFLPDLAHFQPEESPLAFGHLEVDLPIFEHFIPCSLYSASHWCMFCVFLDAAVLVSVEALSESVYSAHGLSWGLSRTAHLAGPGVFSTQPAGHVCPSSRPCLPLVQSDPAELRGAKCELRRRRATAGRSLGTKVCR